MRLFQAWAESLTVFKPENFKPFLLVTLKSIVETYKVLFIKFWPMVIMPFILMGIMYGLNEIRMLDIGFLFGAWGLYIAAWCMLVFLCARPSVNPKTWHYIVGYWRHFIYFCLLILVTIYLVMQFFVMIIKFRISVPSVPSNAPDLLQHFFFLVSLVACMYIILYMAFLLDSDARIKAVGLSLLRAGKMIVYNLPFILISTIVFGCLFEAFFYMSNLLIEDRSGKGINWGSYGFMVFLPVSVCFYMNFYIKKIHEQFNFYFPVKGN